MKNPGDVSPLRVPAKASSRDEDNLIVNANNSYYYILDAELQTNRIRPPFFKYRGRDANGVFKLEVGWVWEVLRTTRLAPDIIRAILDGRQPRHLNLHAMRGRQGEVPLDWEELWKTFGFACPNC